MPELPEVETIVRQLRESAVGKKFWGVDVRLKSVFHPDFETIKQQLIGLRILDVTRRGKFIIFVLDRHMRLVVHLCMSGRLMWRPTKGKEKYIRAVFQFSDATSLYFSDMRKFGRIWFYHKDQIENATGMNKLGVEPFGEDFSEQRMGDIFLQKKGILKNNLLRQDLIAGIGNIYADEICYRIKRHPSTRLKNLKAEDVKKLSEAILHCLGEGIEHCGASVSDFIGTRGTLGKHQKYLQVYGRKGDACYVCESTIEKTRVAGRGTFFCPSCQKQ